MDVRGAIRWSVLGVLLAAVPARAQDATADLPRYDLNIFLDVAKHSASVVQRVTWKNTGTLPAHQLVLNAHAHYSIPDKDIGFLAKMVEILRMSPSEAMSFD